MWESWGMADKSKGCRVDKLLEEGWKGGEGCWGWVIHRFSGGNPQENVERLSLVSFCYVVLDIPDLIAEFWFIFYHFLNFLDGAYDGGVVHTAAAFAFVFLADVHQCEACEFSD